MIIKDIIEAIKSYDTIIIHRHVRPDADALGSQAGLKEIINASFPNKKVYLVGEEDPSLTFLARMDHIADDVYDRALVIVCDTANTERISDKRYDRGHKLVKIDHHPDVDPYGDLQWVDPSASSTSEMIYDLYLQAKGEGFRMTDEAARLIYAGIIGDTGRFLFPSTTQKTFHVAAELVSYPFDRPALYDNLYSIEQNMAKLRGYILQHFTLSPSGLSAVKLPRAILDEYGIKPSETGQLVGVLGDIAGIKAWAFFIEEDEVIRVRLRSKGPVINEIAAKYNGGGHPLAAGASVSTWDEADRVIEDLETVCQAFD